MNELTEFFSKLRVAFSSLPPGRRVSLLSAAFLTMAGIGLLVLLSGHVEYGVLFSNLSTEDAAGIVNKLQERKVPYKLSPAGDTISVPADRVPELRLELAAAGLPQGGGVGFEIFDNKNFGSTEFEQQLNYRRALQGELSRTINSLDEIQQSRVHLALPKESLFTEQSKKATASVTVKLKQGKALRPSQVEGIVRLVASSVEGINPEDVIIVDSRGNILSGVQGDSKLSKMSNSQIDFQRNLEKDTAARIQSMLENVVGKGKAVVRVTAELDFRLTEKTEENYDPDSPVIRSVKRQTEKTASLFGGKTGGSASGNPEREKTDETINYEINRVVNKTVMPVGEIQKLSVAVLVDGIYTKDEKGVEVYKPRTKKDIDVLEDLVKKSVGINEARGDQVVVTEMPFSRVDTDQLVGEQKTWHEKIIPFYPIIKYFIGVIAVLIALFFIIRPIFRDILSRGAASVPRAVHQIAAEVTGEVGGEMYSLTEPVEEKELTDRDIARKLASADSKKFAEVLRTWLK